MNTITTGWASGLLAAAYLFWWAAEILPVLGRWLRRRWLRRTPFGRAVLLRVPVEKPHLAALLTVLAGILVGVGMIALLRVRLTLWEVAALFFIGLVLEELREPRAVASLPGVVRFLENYRSSAASGHDLYGALAAAGEDLPPGPVSLAVEAALEQQIHHKPNEVIFGSLGKASPFLQEAVLVIKANGWKLTGAVQSSLGMIQARSGQALDRGGARRVFFVKASVVRVFIQAWIGGGLLAGMLFQPWVGFAGGYAQEASQLFAGSLAVAFLRYFADQAGLRRLAAGAILAFGMITYINSLPPATRVEASAPTVQPTFTETTTLLPPSPSPTSTVTPTVTFAPKPVIKQETPPVNLPANAKPEKHPRLYPPIWLGLH